MGENKRSEQGKAGLILPAHPSLLSTGGDVRSERTFIYGALNAALVSGEIKFLREEKLHGHMRTIMCLMCAFLGMSVATLYKASIQ